MELITSKVLMVAGTALSAIGAIQQGQAQSAQFKAMQQANEYSAAVARSRAQTALAVGGQREEQQRRAARFQLGSMRAATAQAGLGLGGTAADAERQSEIFAELDALNIRYGSQLESQGLLAQSDLDVASAASYGQSATAARQAGYLNAASSLLSGSAGYMRATTPDTAPKLAQ